MALDLKKLIDPARTALVTSECQRGVMGDLSALPELADAAAGDVTANIAQLVDAARAAGATVIHCVAERREDGRGANRNARLFQYMARAERKLIPGSAAVEIVPEIRVESSDLVLSRLHGVSPFSGTDLDPILRNLGVQTVVGVGVSVNVAIQNLAFDAVNSAYQVVIPKDAVAGFPKAYAEAVFANTLGAIATLVSTAQLVEAWRV
jgi:nicotinamidase-related amidase